MRACGACGQPVPIRWRNERGAPLHVLWHTAGPVVECRDRRRSGAFYVVTRHQACTDCGKTLRHHLRAMWFTPGKSVFELLFGGAPMLVDALDDRGPTCVQECQAA